MEMTIYLIVAPSQRLGLHDFLYEIKGEYLYLRVGYNGRLKTFWDFVMNLDIPIDHVSLCKI